jgi:hypothetical protein
MTEETSKKEIGEVQVSFSTPFQAYVNYKTQEEDLLSRERDNVQLFTLALVRILFLLGENKQAPMLLQYLQTAMGDTVTPRGLNRPTILGAGQNLLDVPPDKSERLMVFKLIQDEENRLAELTLPFGEEGHFYPAAVIFYFQFLIKTLGDASLFFLVLVLGGVMEYYENFGKTNDLKALKDAPVYSFSTAMKYIEEERTRARPSSEN